MPDPQLQRQLRHRRTLPEPKVPTKEETQTVLNYLQRLELDYLFDTRLRRELLPNLRDI